MAVLTAVVSLVLVPAASADPAADRARVRQQQADAVDTLASAEKVAEGEAQQAERARQRAEADVARAGAVLARQRSAVVERAVRAYADQGHVQVLAGVGRPEDAVRRLALAKVVQGRLVDAVDSSRAAVADLGRRRQKQAVAAKQGGGYGNLTLIDHGGGVVTAYGHQSRFAVKEGDQVQQGQVIGYVGSTGHSTGPHLHFEVRVNGPARNPIPYLP